MEAPARVATVVALSSSAVTLASLGDTVRLEAVVKDQDGVELSANVAWSTADAQVASVSGQGTVTAVGNGTTAITAAAGSATASATITVSQRPSTITVTPESVMLRKLGDTATVEATMHDAAGAEIRGTAITWASADSTVATVSTSGTVTAAGGGTTTVTASGGGLVAMASVQVTVEPDGLIYRWTFSEEGGAGTVFHDDIRGAAASIVHVGASTASALAGQVTLTGGNQASADYVALPSGLLHQLDDATIEVWATVHSLKFWSRVFEVGAGPSNNLFLAWSQGTTASTDRTAFTVGGTEDHVDNALAPFTLDLEHHIVVAIDGDGGPGGATTVKLYLDGQPRAQLTTGFHLEDLMDNDFWLGRSHYGDETANASYDEVRIHDRVYSDAEIREFYLRGPIRSNPIASIDILRPAGMRDTIRGIDVRFPLRAIGRDTQGRSFPIAGAVWTSDDPSVATIDSSGVVHAVAEGHAGIRLAVSGETANWNAEVVRIRHVDVDPYLATPIPGALWEVPVVLVEYLPTADGFSLDTLRAPDFYTFGPSSLDSMETRILRFARRRKMMVEEGSRFRGYNESGALPSLGYRVVEHIIVYDQIPPHPTKRSDLPGNPRFEDWFSVFASLQLGPLMEARNVRELWVAWSAFNGGFPVYDPAVFKTEDMRVGWESNMSSPITGDISNSDRDSGDAPVLSHTYIIYDINFRRSQSEAVHNVGHQLEAMMSYVATRQDGNDRLFWRDFVGQNAQGQFITGRAGWTHMPPNTTENYDYLNPTLVDSDIEDWRPDNSGMKQPVNVDTWGKLAYPWPGEMDFPGRVESQWYTFWFQNFPGRGNNIPHGTGWMSNWWAFVADWDAAIQSGLGLYGGSPAMSAGSHKAYPYPASAFLRAQAKGGGAVFAAEATHRARVSRR